MKLNLVNSTWRVSGMPASHRPVWFVSFMTSAKIISAAELCLVTKIL